MTSEAPLYDSPLQRTEQDKLGRAGGFNMSGTDSKAGGPDYLLLFSQAKSISEKL